MRNKPYRGAICVAGILVAGGCGTAALANRALYVLVPATGLRTGFAYGLGSNYADDAKAREGAMMICVEEAKKPELDQSRCRLIEAFKRKCAAIAMDPENHWTGWSVGIDKAAAEKAAIAACSKKAPACKIADVRCDTN